METTNIKEFTNFIIEVDNEIDAFCTNIIRLNSQANVNIEKEIKSLIEFVDIKFGEILTKFYDGVDLLFPPEPEPEDIKFESGVEETTKEDIIKWVFKLEGRIHELEQKVYGINFKVKRN